MTTEEIKKAADELVKEHHKIVEKTNPFTVFTATYHAIVTVKKQIEVLPKTRWNDKVGDSIKEAEYKCYAILKELESRIKN